MEGIGRAFEAMVIWAFIVGMACCAAVGGVLWLIWWVCHHLVWVN